MLVDPNAYPYTECINGTEWDTVICVSRGAEAEGRREGAGGEVGGEEQWRRGQHDNDDDDDDDMLHSAMADNLDLNTVYIVFGGCAMCVCKEPN